MALYALDKAEQVRLSHVDERDQPEPLGRLYAEAERYESAADDLYDRLVTTSATTVGGILAKLEFADEDPKLINSVIGDLLRLVAKDGEVQP